MRKNAVPFVVVLITLMGSIPALPMGGDHPAGEPIGQHPEWPAGLADLLNSGGRVHGYWVNANDWFFYAGDTEALNEFLQKYSRLKGTPLTLVLRPGRGLTGELGGGEKNIAYDWEVQVRRRGWSREGLPDPTGEKGGYVVIAEVWAEGQIKLSKVEVPLNVKVKWGDANEQLTKFVAAHEARRKRAKKADTGAAPTGTEPESEAPRRGKVEEATKRFINLDPYVTAPWEAYYGGDAGSDIPLEPGKQRIGSIDFRIGKGVIQLAGSEFKQMPSEVKGIKVGLKFEKLRILHGTSWDVSEGTRIGSYVIRYEDQSAMEIPIRYGVHVNDWWFLGRDPSEVSGAQVAWTGGDGPSPPVRLYSMTWENPYPNRVVMAIDCSSTGTRCAPFVVAMTVEGAIPSAAAGMPEATKSSPAGTTFEAVAPRKYNSERPLYARLALSKNEAKVLSVVFDESKGTGSGYDLLYADENFAGRFDETEKFEATTLRGYETVISSSFAPIGLDAPYDGNAGEPANWQVAFGYHAPPPASRTEKSVTVPQQPSTSAGTFHITANLSLRHGSLPWRYFMSGVIEPSKELDAAPVWSVCRHLELEVATRPDGRKAGNLGIGLRLLAGEDRNLECKKDGLPAEAHVEIKTPNGRVVHKGDATLDKFTFG